jgi:hypothetical protein
MKIRKIAEKVWEAVYPDRRPWNELSSDTQKEWERFTETAISIYREVEDIDHQLKWLNALESAGVDNWIGIDFARETFDRKTQAAKRPKNIHKSNTINV